MDFKHIIFEKKGGVARLTFNRPPLNILNIEMMNEINEALRDLQEENLKLVIFQAEGKAFCAGVDVSEHSADKVEEMISVFHKMFRLINSLSYPTLAIVNGAALGGGCEVATFCDMIIASADAKFGQPEIKVGVFPPIAVIKFPHLLGRNRALELLLTGDTINVQEAERIGLINKCFSVEEFAEKVEKFIDKITTLSTPVLQLTKKAVNESLYLSFEEAIEKVEKIYLNELMRTEDANEGVKAFLEKRPPKWKDK